MAKSRAKKGKQERKTPLVRRCLLPQSIITDEMPTKFPYSVDRYDDDNISYNLERRAYDFIYIENAKVALHISEYMCNTYKYDSLIVVPMEHRKCEGVVAIEKAGYIVTDKQVKDIVKDVQYDIARKNIIGLDNRQSPGKGVLPGH